MSDEVETVFWKSETKLLKLCKSQFSVFGNFCVTKLKPFFGKARQSVQNWLNWELVIGSILENGFEAKLKSKTNVLSLWKWHFSVFCKFYYNLYYNFLMFWMFRMFPFEYSTGASLISLYIRSSILWLLFLSLEICDMHQTDFFTIFLCTPLKFNEKLNLNGWIKNDI